MAEDDTPDETATEVVPVEEVESRYGAPVSTSRGQAVVHPTRETYLDVVGAARDDGFVMLADVTAVDYLGHPGRALPPGVDAERFELVVNLVDPTERRRLRVRVQVPESDPVAPTLYPLHPGADAPEREVFDMYGITFEGHPDPTRILMPEDWVGHPLRKDQPQGRIPVQFKSATNTR